MADPTVHHYYCLQCQNLISDGLVQPYDFATLPDEYRVYHYRVCWEDFSKIVQSGGIGQIRRLFPDGTIIRSAVISPDIAAYNLLVENPAWPVTLRKGGEFMKIPDLPQELLCDTTDWFQRVMQG